MGARSVDPARRITADSFRLLMAKLAPRPAIEPRPEPVVLKPEPEVLELPEPAAEAAIAIEERLPEATPEAPPETPQGRSFDWANLFEQQAPLDAPPESVSELNQESPEPIQVPAPWSWGVPEEAAPAEYAPAEHVPEEPAEIVELDLKQPVEAEAPEVFEVEDEPIEAQEIEAEPGSPEPPLPVITIDLETVLHPVELDRSELVDSLSERLGANSTLLRRAEPVSDPFAKPAPELQIRRPVDVVEPDPDTEGVAKSLLDIMSGPAGTSQPQERALAADTLLRLAPRLVTRTLIAIAERVSMMDTPPPLLIGFLLRHPREEVAKPLLERASMVSDQDLMGVIAEGSVAKQRMIARRRVISGALADALIATGEVSVLMNLVRNPGAALSQDAFARLCTLARHYPALQAPLATRADTPATVAFELFWVASPDLRRLVLSRFLTESETLSRILKLTLTVGGDGATETKLPPKQKVEEFVDLLEAGRDDDATRLVCEIGNISEATARRILADRQGEPLAVVLKALGLPRGRLSGVLERLQVCARPRIAYDRSLSELQAIFDTLSLTKTRVLLTYWDWAGQAPDSQVAALS
ncbi:MAG: DUF2336 domain-containing protein [Rhizobiales bacterium]|nr:DUF2336 domain-containing protein [Hyphomicrobiales bacterium]